MPPPRRSLSPTALHILLAVAEAPRHGYAIKQEVEGRSQGALKVGPGTLYESIQRLLDAGLLRETEAEAEPANGQEAQRRYYELTGRGRKVLRAEVEQWGRFVDYARRRMEPA
jgi:DNA-binding PadR family transcriptional regulator